MKPVVAPAVGVLLGGVGLASLYRRYWTRLFGLILGFLPVFFITLHNWVFGQELVLFTANSYDQRLLVMPPSAYLTAVRGLLSLDFSGVGRVMVQMADWLSGTAESYWTIPLNAAGVAILIYVVARGRNFDPWLRLLGGAALAQHVVAFFYIGNISRYHFLSWFLTMLVVMVFMHDVGIGWLQRRYPALSERIANHPMALRLASGLSRLQKSAA